MKPRVCMVSWHGCIRVLKQAIALIGQGFTVDLLATELSNGYNVYNTVTVFDSKESLQRAVQSSRADIFHVHNEPDWLVWAVKEASSGRPVVYDVHDLESLRWNAAPDDDEKAAFAAADAIVHVSETCKRVAEETHGEKPGILLYSWPNAEFVGKNLPAEPCWQSLVYQGGLSAAHETPNGVSMRYYLPIVQSFIAQGYQVSLFSASEGPRSSAVYEAAGAFVAYGTIYPAMLAALRVHGWGLLGALQSHPLMEAAMPNKLYEYISQGVVPVVVNCRESAEFVKSHGCGVVLNSLEDLAGQLSNGPWLRRQCLALRSQFVMEAQIGTLIRLYEDLL